MAGKKTLLVFASTFPRWKNDTNPPFVYELSKRLTEEFDVHVLAPSYPGAKDFEMMDKMRVHRFHYFFRNYEKLAGSGGILPTLKHNKWFYFQIPFFMAAEFFALKKLVKQIKPDVIHAHWIIPQGFIAALVHKLTGVEYVVTTHGGDIFGLQGKIPTSMKRFTLRNAKDITVVSTAIKKEIEEKIDSNLNIKVIPMGVDSKLFNPNKRDVKIKKKYGINGPFLLFVGRLSEKKGVRYLIEAMPEVVKNNPDTKLLIVGGGELESELKNLANKLNMQNNITFTGPIPNKDLPKYYATADIFVAPSIITKEGDREGLPVTIMEAMASGCKTISTNLPGTRDLIKNGINGFLVRQKDKKSLSRSIIQVIFLQRGDDKKNDETVSKFDWVKVSDKYKINLLERI